jgi:hypothetical protein
MELILLPNNLFSPTDNKASNRKNLSLNFPLLEEPPLINWVLQAGGKAK